MRLLALIAASVAGLILLLWPKRGMAMDEKRTPLDAIFEKYGARYGVDALLLKAIATVESSLNPAAVRWNPPHDISVGLMQILYLPIVPGDTNSAPKNWFNVDGWADATFEKLKDADFNVRIGAQIIAWNIKTFGFKRGIAVYNAWSARHAGVDGPFPNQPYVEKVLRVYARLREKAA